MKTISSTVITRLLLPHLTLISYLGDPDNLGEQAGKQEVRNERALFVYNRVKDKLTGRDIQPGQTFGVTEQVERLIAQATSLENLCQCFSGWCVTLFVCQLVVIC